MSNDLVGAPGDLPPKWSINFGTRATLSRPINQPAIIDDPVGLAAFGDTSTIFLALVTDPGAGVYTKLGTIKAKTYIHGWTVSSGWIYVLDGVELVGWDIRNGEKRAAISLLKDTEAQKAIDALADLQKAQQRVEWATLLEQAEEDWLRVTAQQAAAAAGSAERDQLDTIASDSFRMLKSLREVTGSAGGGVAARQLVAELRKALAAKRTAAAPWCFSAPVVRRRSFEETQRAIFTVQGDGRLYACDKSLTQVTSAKWKNQAELHLALLEDLKSSLRLLAYVSEGSLQVVDAKTFDEKNFWTPETRPANGTTHTVAALKDQIWWGTDSGVYACQADDNGKLLPAWSSGLPWTTRQVGRLNAPVTSYNPPVDPNELFDTMNVRTWIEQRANKSALLNDGMLTLLMLSDEAGKYTTPPSETSYILHGPFERDASSSASRWTQIKPHHSGSMVLLSDSRGASSFCRYPLAGVSQLVPQWSVASWFSVMTRYSALDLALSQSWPTAVRRVSKPHADMVAWLRSSPVADKVQQYENLISVLGHKIGDADIRLTMWHALLGAPPPDGFYTQVFKDGKSILDAVFNASEQQTLRARFGQPGAQWELISGKDYGRNYAAKTACQVNFDPPWVNKSVPANLFHSTPPLWYDPWGYNRPGDFIPEQPPASYLDPFCFTGQLRAPQRRINFDTSFKVRSWAVFTDNDPTLILRSAKPPTADGKPVAEPKPLRAAGDPNVLVVTADEDRQRSTLRVLPPKPLRIIFDATTHTLRNEASDFGSIGSQVLTSPVVYLNPGKPVGTPPTAWCVTAPEFPSARLRRLAKADEDGVSDWDKFLDSNRAQYGPRGSSQTWQIDSCPLPSGVLPLIVLQGFGLPVS
jgi:hypothetical protein